MSVEHFVDTQHHVLWMQYIEPVGIALFTLPNRARVAVAFFGVLFNEKYNVSWPDSLSGKMLSIEKWTQHNWNTKQNHKFYGVFIAKSYINGQT